MDLSTLTVAEARRSLDAKKYSALDLTNAYLEQIEKFDGEIHAYLEIWQESARAEAKSADERIAQGESKPLLGIPMAIKDNMLIEGRHVSAASKILENYIGSYDATVIEKLKAQGAVFLGRVNMDEFAMGSSTETSAYGVTKNPVDLTRVPGGSSGGSAAAVAGNLALVSLGSDTGGSIRQPASLTGIVGLKPTYGAVSRYGLMALSSSLDQIGPFGKCVDDVRIVYDVIRGHDPKDSTSLPDSPIAPASVTKVLGVPRAFLAQGCDADVLVRFEETLEKLRSKGYEIRDIKMPTLPHSLAVYYIIQPAEASTNLARYDGIRYGLSVPAESAAGVNAKTRGTGFGREVRRRILIGTFVLSSGYADAYYRKARDVRASIRAEFDSVFTAGVDAVVTPTTPSPAFKFGEKSDPVAMYAEDVFAVPVNLAGVPALSLPMGEVDRDGTKLPIGFQIIAKHGAEATLLSIATDIEQ